LIINGTGFASSLGDDPLWIKNIIKAMGSLLDGISSFPVKLKMIIEFKNDN
jgi:hypothetical protein